MNQKLPFSFEQKLALKKYRAITPKHAKEFDTLKQYPLI
jgi:hypothetical protein